MKYILGAWAVLILFLGYTTQFSTVFAANPTVDWQWAKRLGAADYDEIYGTTIDSDGNVYVTGSVIGDADVNGDGDSTDGGAESSTGYDSDDLIISSFSSTGVWRWAKRLGGASTDLGLALTVDSNNNVVVVGKIENAADVNGDGDRTDGATETTGYGDQDVVISVFNSSGTWQWAKRLGGSQFDRGIGVAADSTNNIIVAGRMQGNTDVNGDGDNTDGGAETGFAQYDGFVSVFNSSGTWQWAKRFGGNNSDEALSVSTDSNNNIVVGGYINNNADVNGDGDNTDGGAETGSGSGQQDMFVTVFNSSGTWQWAKRLGSNTATKIYGVDIDSENNIVAVGSAHGAVDVNGDDDTTDGGAESAPSYDGSAADGIITVFNSSGTWQWAKRLGGNSTDAIYGVAIDGNNHISVAAIVIGSIDVNGDGDTSDGGAESATGYGLDDIIISTFNSSGTWQWAKRLGSTSYDYAYTIAAINNTVIIAGSANGAADVNGDGDNTDGGAESATGYADNDMLVSVFQATYDSTGPSITLSPISDPTTDTTPTISGTAVDTSGTVSDVEFQIDSTSGSWTDCIADDSTFDEASETFVCTVASALSIDTHTIYVRATDDSLNTSSNSSDSFTIQETATENFSSASSSSSSAYVPQIPQLSTGDNGGGAFTPTGDSHTKGQHITTIIEPKTFTFDAFVSAQSTSISQTNVGGLLPNPFTGIMPTVGKTKTNAVLAGGTMLGVKSGGSIVWQVGNVQQIWYKAYAPAGSDKSPAKIIPELQKKPSIVALSYTDANLIPPGKPKSRFNAKTLKLAHSVDGVTWKILPTSVVDTKNKTVAALHKVGGYYMVVGR